MSVIRMSVDSQYFPAIVTLPFVGRSGADRDIAPHARDVLDRADGVDRHSRRTGDRAARLDHQLRHLQAPLRATGGEGVKHGLDEIARSGRVVVSRVCDAESATGTQLAWLEVQLVTEHDKQ